MRNLDLTMRGVMVGVMLLIAACPSDKPDAHECSTGIYCAAGTQCAAVQAVCITTNCGNGIIDSGEQCDDGNILAGDGCSPTCQLETCGNGIIDPGEVCDLGAGNNGKCQGCSIDCKSDEMCGNGIIDPECGEVCDNGPNVANACNGCDETCKSTQVCGNGIVDTECGEVCDPPGVAGCQPGCTSTGMCGNGVVDPGEQCDNGINMGSATYNCDHCDCLTDCVLNRCGDGFVDTLGAHPEQCDLGSANGPTSGCSLNCTTPACGNGILDEGEQCDQGSNNSNTGDCLTTCQINVCGDGFVDSTGSDLEQCDDGSANGPNDTCSKACTLAACGDGVVEKGEQCDLGSGSGSDNNGSNTDCTLGCKLNVCGDGLQDTRGSDLEACDNGSNNTDDPNCPYAAVATPCAARCSKSCTPLTTIEHYCGDGVVDSTNGEQCDDSGATKSVTTCSTYDGSCRECSASCQIVTIQGPYCGDHACNGAETAATCPQDCAQVCGDGVIEGTETCDDSGATKTQTTCTTYDGSCKTCSASCAVTIIQGPYCGDGTCTAGHETAASCPADCAHDCGDGVIEPPETCDDSGATQTQTTCATYDGTCTVCHACVASVIQGPYCGDHSCNGGETALTCPGDCTAVCGNGILEEGETCDDSGATKTQTACGTYDGACTICTSACKVAVIEGPYCGDGTCTTADETAKTCPADCPSQCGDDKIEGSEQCDDGSATVNITSCGTYDGTCTACSSACTSEVFLGPYCGDGICQATGEGTHDETVTNCNTDCHSTCGNGVIEPGETCDDGALNGHETCTTYDSACLICSATCQVSAAEGPYCGDGVCQAGHETSTTCSVDCYCGNGTIDSGEVCDGTNVGTETCAMATGDMGEVGTLTCEPGCAAYDTAACTGCHDGIKNGGESGIDCGGTSTCGGCTGDACMHDSDCADDDCDVGGTNKCI